MSTSQKEYYQQVNSNKDRLSFWEYPVLSHIVKGSKVLELGGGDGFFAEYLIKNYQVDATVVELSEKNIQALAKKNIKHHQIDLEKAKMPFEDNSFDCIIMLEVIEHIFNHHGLLKEAQRLLKPGGKFIISTHNAFNLRSRWNYLRGKIHKCADPVYPPTEHIRLFSWNSLKTVLKNSGFNNIKSFSVYNFEFKRDKYLTFKSNIGASLFSRNLLAVSTK